MRLQWFLAIIVANIEFGVDLSRDILELVYYHASNELLSSCFRGLSHGIIKDLFIFGLRKLYKRKWMAIMASMR